MDHPTEEQLVTFRFGDTGDAAETAAIQGHLASCGECRASMAAVDDTLAAVARMPVPERSEAYGAEVWARLQPRLTGARRRWWHAIPELLAPRRLALAGGLAVVVLAAFVAGRFWPGAPAPGQTATQQEQPAPAGVPHEQVRERILLVAVGDHLERSQMALVELVNAGNSAVVDISSERARARDLVTENRLYRQTAEETGDAGVAGVLDDLERVLVEIANGPSELPRADFDRVRERIESQGIIFKVRVLGERVRERESRPVANGLVEG
jgi:hypothetical protein